MKNKIAYRILVTILIFGVPLAVIAADTAKNEAPPAAAAVAQSESGDSDEPIGMLITGLAGGYFTALGDMGEILEPAWTPKLFVFNNMIDATPFGLALEISYAKLNDIDNRGSVSYMPAILYATIVFSPFSLFDVQAMGGVGLTSFAAKVDNGRTIKNRGSVDFTWSAGGAVMKTLYKHYVIGIECNFYYFFERVSSRAAAANLFAGYRF